MSKSKIRRRGSTPANWQFRDGRPRWVASPSLRLAGWKGCDLKAGDAWLGKGASIDAAEAINKAVAAWRLGAEVPAVYAPLAPAGAAGPAVATRAQVLDRRAIGRLIDDYLASNEFLELRDKTRTEYRSKLKRLVDTLAGYAVLPARDGDQRPYAAAVARIRAAPVDALLTPEEDDGDDGLLYKAYWLMRSKVSLHMANGVMAVASAWLDWCKKRRRVIRTNPARDVDRNRAPGRLRPATWEELAALIDAAETLGYPSIADSIILGVDLSWSQSDRLALTWPQIVEDRVRARRLKTNRPGETRLLEALGKPRVAKIRARQKATLGSDALYTHVLICETTGEPWKDSHYRHTFAEVRTAAAAKCASAAKVYDKDLRSTAVGVAYDAGLSRVQIAGRTLHSLRQIDEILDNHYGVISREVGDQGADLLNEHLKKKGIKL